MAISVYHCPKCSRSLTPSGTLSIDGEDAATIFQCDECLQKVDMMGETWEVAFTFAVRADGSWFDPKTDED
jgi:DNA-directed RNA polymerase subunit RPC12/RpoP